MASAWENLTRDRQNSEDFSATTFVGSAKKVDYL
jgi:hypothetical protein